MLKKIPMFVKLSIEPIVFAIISVLFHLTLDTTLAWIFTIIGSALSLNNFTVAFSLKAELDEVKSSMCNTSTLCSAYLKVSDPDFLQVRDIVLSRYMEEMRDLSTGIYNISGNQYYEWMTDQVKKCKSNIRAISGISEYMWIIDQREISFFDANIQAANRNVNIERIFVTSKKRIHLYCNRLILQKSIQCGMKTYIIYLEHITDAELKRIAQKGFLLLDYAMLFLDIEPPSETMGQVNKLRERINQYNSYFDRLRIQAKNAVDEILQINKSIAEECFKKV